MKLRSFILLLAILFFSGQNPVSAQLKKTFCVPVNALSEVEYPFKAGEYFSFVLHYKWGMVNADLGKAYVKLDTTVFNGVPVYHCMATGRTLKFYDMFFKVREAFQSWFTRDGLKPMRFTRNTREGDYEARNDYMYRRAKDNPRISANLYTSKKGQYTMELPLTSCTYDIPSLFYMARNIDLSNAKPDTKFPMTFVIDDDVFNIFMVYKGREIKEIQGIGKIKALKFSIQVVKGEVFNGDDTLFLWISDDRNRIPLSVETGIKVGHVSARLTSYSGLRYPFESLVK